MTEPTSWHVLSAVAAATETDPTDLAPLTSVIDADALDALFAHRENGNRQAPGGVAVTFEYDGVQVKVREGDRVTVEPLAANAIGELESD